MTEQVFWEQLQSRGNLDLGVIAWYETWVSFGLLWVVGLLFVMTIMMAEKQEWYVAYFWLLLSSIPVVLVFPSFYMSQDPLGGAAYFDFSYTDPQQISQDALDALSNHMTDLAYAGMFGAILAPLALLFRLTWRFRKELQTIISNVTAVATGRKRRKQ